MIRCFKSGYIVMAVPNLFWKREYFNSPYFHYSKLLSFCLSKKSRIAGIYDKKDPGSGS